MGQLLNQKSSDRLETSFQATKAVQNSKVSYVLLSSMPILQKADSIEIPCLLRQFIQLSSNIRTFSLQNT